MPDFLGECLFAAFDRDQNGTIDVEEFLSGMALCLQGRVKDKCRLLFKIFNLDDDEGIMREGLATVLSSALLSANAVLQSILTQEEDKSEHTFEKVKDTIKMIVDNAFETCDTSRNGKLEIDKFVKWVHKNPELVDNILVIYSVKHRQITQDPFHVISTPDNAPESERIVSQHDTPAVVQTDENAQGKMKHIPTSSCL